MFENFLKKMKLEETDEQRNLFLVFAKYIVKYWLEGDIEPQYLKSSSKKLIYDFNDFFKEENGNMTFFHYCLLFARTTIFKIYKTLKKQ